MEDSNACSLSEKDAVNSENIENNSQNELQTSSVTSSGPSVQDTSSVSPAGAPGISSHQCGLCGATFSLITQYLAHRVDNHAGQQKGMSCELCGTAYTRQTTLRDHYKKKHRISFNTKQSKTVKKPLSSREMVKPTGAQTRDDSCEGSSDDNEEEEDDSTKTIHVVITKTDEDGGTTSELRTEAEDSGGQTCPAETETSEIDMNTEINNAGSEAIEDSEVEKMDIDDKRSELKGEMINSGPKMSEKTVSESEAIGSLKTFDEADDFHFVLLKNMINGNSFKYSKDRFKCLHCEFKSYWRNSICTHMKDMHQDMMSIHQFIEIKPAEIDNTQSDQSIIKMSDYIASLHQKKTKSSQYRIRSVEKQDLPGHFPCPKCNKEFNRLRYLRKHMLVHKTDKKYLCDECGKAFKTRSYLKTHYRTHKARLYKCSQCNFSSSVNAVIHAHRQLHNDGSVICDVCGFAYADKSTLKKHKLVHDPDRPFPCTFPGCTWRFKTKVMCLAHYNAHTTEGKFRCSVCGYVFRHKHHLQRHQGKMHGITNMTNVTIVEEDKNDEKDEEISDVPDTVNLIVNSDLSRDQLQTALQNGQLVIATDSEGNTINYEVADITMNVTYHTLLEDESELGDTQTILHVATIDSQDDTTG